MKISVLKGQHESSRRSIFLWWLMWILWLPFFIPMAIDLIKAHPSTPRLVANLAGAALFFAIYVVVAWRNAQRLASGTPRPHPSGWMRWAPVIALVTLSAALTLLNGQTWGGMVIFTSACVAGWLPPRQALWIVAGLVAFTVVGVGIIPGQLIASLQPAAIVAAPGLVVIVSSHSIAVSQRLRAEREAAARSAAVAEERLRIARDLHDLLGHNLSQIALRSEVAEYLASVSPEQAAAAMHEVADVARAALQEVRAAVAGYRQPTLAGELRGARELLAAAGVSCQCEGDLTTPAPAIESLLAWAVREGVTNVVKHSRAHTCMIRVLRGEAHVGIEIRDDGVGGDADDVSARAPGSGGSGLLGLGERCAALGGRCEAGPRPQGGFRLAVVVPLSSTSGAEMAADGRVPMAPAAERGVRS